jgi:hypothetical protein
MAKETSQIDARLREGGFDPGAAPDQALPALKQLRGAPGVTDTMIAQALGGIVSPDSAALLVEMEASASGPLRREIRRALFKLRQRGVEAPEPKTSAAVAATTSEVGLTGLLSPADAAGARIAWLLKARGTGGLRRLWCLVSETEGLLGATLESITRKEYRADREEVERRAGTRLVDADWRLVDFVVCEAYRRTPENRRGRVGNFLTIRTELIETAPVLDFAHPIYDETAAQLETDPSPDLMQEADVGAYRLPADIIKPFADEVTSLRESTLVLNRMQQEERVSTVVERAIAELLSGDVAYRLRRHLEDTAYFFAHSGKPASAGWAAAAAGRIRDGADLKRIAFFQRFMRAQLGAILTEQQEQTSEEPRLIMTPAEAMRARQAAEARMRGRGR